MYSTAERSACIHPDSVHPVISDSPMIQETLASDGTTPMTTHCRETEGPTLTAGTYSVTFGRGSRSVEKRSRCNHSLKVKVKVKCFINVHTEHQNEGKWDLSDVILICTLSRPTCDDDGGAVARVGKDTVFKRAVINPRICPDRVIDESVTLFLAFDGVNSDRGHLTASGLHF